MSNKIIVLWGFLVVSLVCTIFILGKINERDNSYNQIKEELKKVVKEYLDEENAWPLENEEIDVSSVELINKSYIDELMYEGKTYSGTVTVKNNDNKYKYSISLECLNIVK